MSLFQTIRSIIKDASLKSGIYDETFFNVYPYMYEPEQLLFLTNCLAAITLVSGCIVEAGCAFGATTVFLNKFLTRQGAERDYYAIDTFSGFVDDQAAHEIEHRGKPASLKGHFTENKKAWFDKSMALHDIKRVKSVQCDVTKFDFAAISPIAFCLLDVDLYKPIKDVLPKIYAAMAPGGIIVVDDCQPSNIWDGALQAYDEFVEQKGLPREIAVEKLGIIRA